MRRALSLLVGPMAAGTLLCTLAMGQNSGLDLLHKMQRALGGADKIAAIHDLDWTVRAETFAGGFKITSPAANVIRLTSKGSTSEITLNPVTWLPAQTLEWMDVQGVRFPARELNSHKDDGSADIRTEKVAFNISLNPRDLAAKPADLKPVLAGR